MSYEAEVLARQLGDLGRDLDKQVTILGELEEDAVEAEGEFRKLGEEYEDALARVFMASPGSIDQRKAQARLECVPERIKMQQAAIDWNRLKAEVRTQQASLQALHRRIEIGRSLLSREKALISLGGVGEV